MAKKAKTKTSDLWRGVLPDGDMTTDRNQYVREWREMAMPLEALGLKLSSYDPDFEFIDMLSRSDLTVSVILPKWFVLRLGRLLKTSLSLSREV
jgi:hypothetical protein